MKRTALLQIAVHLASLVPAAHLAWGVFHGKYLNPVDALINIDGFWALAFLALCLAVSPLRRFTGWNGLIKLRRPLGLYAFFYGCLHLSSYFLFDKRLQFGLVAEDLVKRRYIFMGMATWLLLLPLALTSTAGSIRRLGRNWSRLHWLIYPAALTGLIHLWWKVKAIDLKPLAFAAAILGLLLIRLIPRSSRPV